MKSNVIIRLIDVVLNLLFGFISISEINRLSQIELPESSQLPLTNPDKEQILIIGITQTGQYLLEDETKIVDNTTDLRNFIFQRQQKLSTAKIRIRVRIRSDREAPSLYTFQLANICDELNIVKSIDVERKGT
jgi:biopolymer transport protein ExbD